MVEKLIFLFFDVVMCAGLLWLAWRMLTTTDLFMAVVLFISFGLLMSLAWIRLNAPDVALAEASLGSGVTGALFLATLGRMQPLPAFHDFFSQKTNGVVVLLSLMITMTLSWILFSVPDGLDGLRTEALSSLPDSGVSSPVTAVLLNFRGYDTLLELVVLLTAAIGVWALGNELPTPESKPPQFLFIAVRMLIPLIFIVASYLLWIGSSKPGGAFQGGAVLAAAGILWLLAGLKLNRLCKLLYWRILLVIGPIIFSCMALIFLISNKSLLTYPAKSVGSWILLIEAGAFVSITITLIALFMGGKPNNL